METIIIIDFGGQYCHLIARRLRDPGIENSIVSADKITLESLKNFKGIILSGGAYSVYAKNAPVVTKKILQAKLPVLGICYGHQLIAHILGGKVSPGKAGEYGPTKLKLDVKSDLFRGLKPEQNVWMNHRDVVERLPKDFKIVAKTDKTKMAAIENTIEKIYGVQFHPEVTHTKAGQEILKNFVGICKIKSKKNLLINKTAIILEAKTILKNKKAIIGLSGGIDSSVAAILVSKAIGKNLTAVYVDTGLMRYGETENFKKIFSHFDLKLVIIDASHQYFKKLKGVASPELKRKIIGHLFIKIFEKIARTLKATYLIQGTIYPDRIESGITKNSSSIKSHHNVGGLPPNLKLKIYEPLKDLYKDEVRAIARQIKLPHELLSRQVFPGPGLAVRIVGEVTQEKAKIVREAGRIIEEELRESPYWQKIWMSFAVLLPVKSVGIQGDERSYKHPIVLRIIESEDAMTANFSKIPYPILEKISTRITNEIPAINRVVYDITNKPPATMEWE
jgi:GMP synthase (glutamine-hydrolysing)